MHYEIIDYNSSRLQKTTVTIEEMTDQFNTGVSKLKAQMSLLVFEAQIFYRVTGKKKAQTSCAPK